jgi:hypothetical protein
MSDARLCEFEEECGALADERGIWARAFLLSMARIAYKQRVHGVALFDEIQRLADRLDEVFAEGDEIERLEALWNDLPTLSNERGSDDDDD